MKRVILESPYKGDIESNIGYARKALRHSLMLGECPIASHLLYTQPGVLDDDDPVERPLGIDAGLEWRFVSDGTVVYADRGITAGMMYGIDLAERAGKPVVCRYIE